MEPLDSDDFTLDPYNYLAPTQTSNTYPEARKRSTSTTLSNDRLVYNWRVADGVTIVSDNRSGRADVPAHS